MEGLSVNVGHHPKQADVTLMTVKGFIDTTTAPEFEKAFQGVLSDKQANEVLKHTVGYSKKSSRKIF